LIQWGASGLKFVAKREAGDHDGRRGNENCANKYLCVPKQTSTIIYWLIYL
jgi:hypothetical protein